MYCERPVIVANYRSSATRAVAEIFREQSRKYKPEKGRMPGAVPLVATTSEEAIEGRFIVQGGHISIFWEAS